MEPSPVEAGSVRVRLQGYGVLSRPGAPAVPRRVERIALPDEGTPRLRIVRVISKPLPSMLLETVPFSGGPSGDLPPASDPHGPPASRPDYRRDPELEASGATYPEDVATLGEVGYLRDQRYVDLILTPLQVRGGSGTARIAQKVELEISLAPGSPGAPRRMGRSDAHGEALYRGAFLNESQRLETGAAAPLSRPATEAATVEAGGGTSIYRVGVKQEGMYRISCVALPGCAVADLIGLDPASFRLKNKGVEVPIRIVGGQDASFDLGDILEFYGQAQVDPFTTQNCAPPTCAAPIYEAADYTDLNVYILDAPGAAGRLRMASLDGTPGGLTAEPHFLETAHAEVNDFFAPLNNHDPFYWSPSITVTTSTLFRDLSVPLPGVASASFTSPVVVRMLGVSTLSGVNPDHRTRLTVNSAPATTTTLDWDGETVVDHTTSASQSLLTNPTTLRLEVVTDPTISVDQVRIDYAEIAYRRLFQAVGDRLSFDFPNQSAKFSVQAFTGGGILAYDVSRTLAGTANTREPRLVANASSGPTSLTFQVGAEAAPTGPTRRFWVVGPTGYLSPDSIVPLQPNNLLDTANEADYLIIAHPSLINATPGGAYDQFVSYLTNVRGLTVRLVMIQEIYDSFSNSIEDPEAIRSFLAYAHDHWVGPSGTAPPPAYLLLVGDATWDPKNNLGRSDWVDLVPTAIMFYDLSILKYYSADAWLASFLGNDQSPDILFGRIPVRTAAQADVVFNKLRAYQQSPPTGPWRSDGYFLADVGNVTAETDSFEGEEDAAASYFVSPWTQTKQYYARPPYSSPVGGGGPVAQYKADFVSHWNSAHPAVASFSGHGAFDILGNDLFFRPADVPLLTNGPYQPFFYNSDCLTGGFHAVGVDSMAEAFLQSSAGGSIGYFAPAGLSFIFFAQTVSGQLFADLFGPEKIRQLGSLTDRARGALYQQSAIADMQGFAFVGDPALDLVLPAPKPPLNFAATAGNAQVGLSWSPSPDPASMGTNIYRTQTLGLPYTKINAAPVAGTSFTDTNVSNGSTYFYRAVSIDAAGFEGAVTNTNDDCSTSGGPDGPDCRRAKPINLVPPAVPQGLKVKDTGSGSVLNVSWLANSEPDLQRYVISYGTVPGSHPQTVNAGLSTSVNLNGLVMGTTYYVVVRAINTSSVESADSPEASGTPHHFFGVAAPATIQDLMVNQSGNDLVLTWSPVTTDINGNPIVINHYNVYRGSTPDFVPSNSVNRLAQVPASGSPSYTHLSGVLAPDNGYYLVSAEDFDGVASGLGGDLPAGILALTVAPSPTPGMLRLSWPVVTQTVTGQPARISHYTLYGASTPLPRSAISVGNLMQDNILGTSLDVADPVDQKFFYNVIVVDERGNLSPY